MKLVHTWIVGCILAFPPATLSLAQESARMADQIEQKLAALESSWVEGGNQEYFAQASGIADWLSKQQGSQAAAAAKLLQALLHKRVESVDVGTADLSAKAKASRAILRDESSTQPAVRKETLQALATFLGSIRQEMIPNFTAKPVTMNVMPPKSGSGPRIAGMDPNAIADPVARERYKAAILENRQHAMMNSRQTALRNMQAEFTQPIIDFMARVAYGDDVGLSLVQESVPRARLTDAERAAVFNGPGL